MSSTVAVDVPSSLADLKTQWAELSDVDRALAVHALHSPSLSFHQLAKELGCSASQLRNLDRAAQAPAEDLDLARKKQISTRELVRRARAAAAQRADQDREALDQKRNQAARKAALTICNWLEERQILPAHGEGIIDESRRILAQAEYLDQLPKCSPPPPGMPTAEVIIRTKPPASVHPDIESVGWYAAWLARWAFFAFPDSVVRDRALNLALDYQIRGMPAPSTRRRK